ncbi:MAG: ribosome maturation factor RimM [Candidatus Limnocylindrales bacterium]
MTRPPADAAPERLVVGLVRGLQGLRGTVRVEVLSDVPERFQSGSVLYREGSMDPLTVTWQQADGPGLLVRFREVRTREQAVQLLDGYHEAETLPTDLADDAVWWLEVEGVVVGTADGQVLGRCIDVFRSGGGEVLVVEGGAFGELLIPVVRPIIVEFAPRESRIVVDADALGLEPVRPRRPRGRRSSRAALPSASSDAVTPAPSVAGDPETG